MPEQGSLWKSALPGGLTPAASALNSSIAVDRRLWREDIQGSLIHAAMLGRQGIIPPEAAESIAQGLEGIRRDIEDGTLQIDEQSEDIHSFIELELTRRVGAPGRMLHTARSRNDQVALDLRLWLRAKTEEITLRINRLLEALVKIADEHASTLMPGMTHLQHAQPQSLGQHMMAYAMMFLRDRGRLGDAAARMNFSPLGSCALAGTAYPIDSAYTADALGFTGPCQNSLDAVSDRDFCLETQSALAILMTHLSRLAEELILWSSSEFGFARMGSGYSTGSSIMPQKRNPDLAELIRGKAGRVYGDLVSTLVMLKGLPLAYNKDMQEDKEAVFDAVDTAILCLDAAAPMLSSLRFQPDTMRKAAQKGYLNATDLADYLVMKG
ncbi:MAG: argininosuccinate lyase, partial [Eubacteriales bacterium]